VRTGSLLEPLRNATPFLVATVKPSPLAHVRTSPTKMAMIQARGKAGYD
jgi:hypothetical protein